MRTTRNLSDLTKQRISDSMKKLHQQRGTVAHQQTAEKQSDGMKRYWETIPQTSEKDDEKEE